MAEKVAQRHGVKAFESARALAEVIDAATIATPTVTHHELGELLLGMGKHVLIEKPITDNTDQAKKLVDLAHAKNAILQVGHIERFNPALNALEEKLTKPRFIEAHRLSTYPGRSTDIGVVLDLMIHDIEVVLHLVRSPIQSIDSVGTAVLSKGEDIANARIRFENGCVANITTSRISFEKVRKIRVFQDDAYLSLDYFEPERRDLPQDQFADHQGEDQGGEGRTAQARARRLRGMRAFRPVAARRRWTGREGTGDRDAYHRADREAKRSVRMSANPDRALVILMVAGEPSGDAHGAELIQSIRERNPRVRIIGVGGPRMAAAGQEQLFDLSAEAVVGLVRSSKSIASSAGFRDQILDLARRERPDAVVLIDCSGFNLRLSPVLRRDLPGARLIYYISPQVWASRPGRVTEMQRDLDLVLSILPFEKDWYAKRAPGFRVEWVGHPVLDRIRKIDVAEPNGNFIALLPGSRRTEVEKHLPVLWEAALIMGRSQPGLKFILLSPNETIQKHSLEMLAKLPAPNFTFEYNVGYAISHLSRCALAFVASGTASLECALVGIPQVVVYRVHPLTFAVGKRVVTVKFLSMVNVMANERVVPEFLQDDLTAAAVAQEGLELLNNPQRRETMKRRVAEVVATLGEPGASKRAAAAIPHRGCTGQGRLVRRLFRWHDFDSRCRVGGAQKDLWLRTRSAAAKATSSST